MPDQLRIGDEVTVLRNPWKGFTGVIVEPFAQHGLDWVVELRSDDAADGHRTAQPARNLRKAAQGA